MRNLKKLLLVIFALLTTVTLRAQFFAILTDQKVSGIVYFKDGSSKEYSRMTLPIARDKAVIVHDENNKKKTIEGRDVEAMECWNENSPDAHYYFGYAPYNFFGIDNCWGVVLGVSEHLIAYKITYGYGIDKKGNLIYFKGQGNPPTYVYVKRKTNESYSGIGKRTIFHKHGSAFFADDPDLSARIKSKEVVISDYQFILDNYSPQGSQNKVEEKAEAKEETVVEENVEAESQNEEE